MCRDTFLFPSKYQHCVFFTFLCFPLCFLYTLFISFLYDLYHSLSIFLFIFLFIFLYPFISFPSFPLSFLPFHIQFLSLLGSSEAPAGSEQKWYFWNQDRFDRNIPRGEDIRKKIETNIEFKEIKQKQVICSR